MIRLFRTDNQKTREVHEISNGTWVELQSPTTEEAATIADLLGVDEGDIMAAIDIEEKARVEVRETYTLILVDIPTMEVHHGRKIYETLPLGIIFTNDNVITICSKDTPVLSSFHMNNKKDFSTKKKLKFIYQIMLRASLLYQRALSDIDKKRLEFEDIVESVTVETDLIKLHELESTLVYFATALRSNNNVLNRLTRSSLLSPYEDDKELLDNVIVENQQAIEMAQIYREIIDSTRELMSSVVNLRMNNVVKRLTSVTVIFSVPMIISGMYGMNVDERWMPLAKATHGFGLIGIMTVVICAILALFLKRHRMM